MVPMTARAAFRTALALAAVIAASAAPASAQISPGELAKVHASIDGSAGCLKCHAPQKGVDPERCLACHTVVRDRVAAGRGLHARPEYRKCETCHIDHQGRDTDLRWWGPKGVAGFNHGDTGYVLEGKHRALECAKCHNESRIANPAALKRGGGNPGRTYLGLGTTCVSCHADTHAGQFGAKDCLSCHTLESWKPATRFDHAKTRYPLTGRHAPVACEKCHPAAAGPKAVRRFAGVASASCANCHKDTHAGRLGAACDSCHTTTGWNRLLRASSFDHTKTAYPLAGAHRTVACEKCHKGSLTARLKYQRCTDCHTDAHRGEFASRPDKGACESCHDVTSFALARYSFDEHQKSPWPLEGAHRAVPCSQCHARNAGQKTPTYRVVHDKCTACHTDTHRGSMNPWTGPTGCATCHNTNSWRAGSFDHAATRFPLTRGHERVTCAACHTSLKTRKAGEPLTFKGLGTTCASCHRDVHAGQLAREGQTLCERCHTGAAWKPAEGFSHNRDATYALDGQHARVPCASCHRPETIAGQIVVRYKPLGATCANCHAGKKS